jgi:hypothetical protein
MQHIATPAQFETVTRTVGPLVPVWTASLLQGVSQQALRRRILRGTLSAWFVNGAVFVSLPGAVKGGKGGCLRGTCAVVGVLIFLVCLAAQTPRAWLIPGQSDTVWESSL